MARLDWHHTWLRANREKDNRGIPIHAGNSVMHRQMRVTLPLA